MAHKEFQSARAEAEKEPITFSVPGEKKRFTCVNSLDYLTLERVITYHRAEDSLGIALQIGPFFRSVLVEADVERFEEFLVRKVDRPTPEMLAEVMSWIIEEYTGRPTKRPSASRGRPRKSSGNSKAGPSSTVAAIR